MAISSKRMKEGLVSTKEDAGRIASAPINWSAVNAIHKEWKENSFAFLRDNLNTNR